MVAAAAKHPNIEQLQSLHVFSECSREQLDRVSRTALLFHKIQGEPVLTHGNAVIGLYILLRGTVGIFLPQAKQASFQLVAPTFLGEIAFIDANPASATVRVTSQDLEFIVIPRERLIDLCQADPRIGLVLYRHIAETLANRLRSANLAIAAKGV